ncbi:MAG: type II toxin-antitoxin system HicB family antitoxin [Clostridia bacterium]|nr:type II toxin-antitoxin system HicB family antitoxin [Clostridia bacterium]
MRKVYPALLTQNESGEFTIRVPDVNGCVTTGKTLEETLDNIRDALAGCLCSLEDAGQSLPEPSTPAAVADSQSTVVLVDVDPLEYRKQTDTKFVRKNVSMPAWLAYMADKRGLNRSQILQEALKKELQIN